MAVTDISVNLADDYTSADPTNWFKISDAPADASFRIQVLSDNAFDGNTVAVELRDSDGVDGATTITLESGVTALGASSAEAYILSLADGDEIRLNPSAGGGSMSLNIALVPLCRATVTEQV